MKTKKQIALYAGVGIVFILILLAACKNQETLNANKDFTVIRSPFQSVNVAFATYQIDPSIDNIITTQSGTKISIKANSLTDTSGNPISEKCEIAYREFMNAADIMAAGIPMAYKNAEANINQSFTSAGMFEIKASLPSGKEVVLAADKPMNIDLASNEKNHGYSNFYLNNKTGAWIYSGEEQVKNNEEKILLANKIEKLKLTSSFAEKNYFVLNTSSMLDIFYNDNRDKIYSYYNMKKPRLPKRLLQYGVKSNNMYSYNSVFLNKYELPANMVIWENVKNVKFPKWTDNSYADVKQVKGNIYELTVKKNGSEEEVFKIKIKAVMSIKHMFAFKPEYWKTNYDGLMIEIKKDEERLAQMKEVFRTLQVSSFGVHNCDKFYSMPEAFVVNASFQLPSKENSFKPEKVYYVSLRDKSLITYKYDDITKITLCKDPTASLITVLADNMMAEVSAKDLFAIKNNGTGKQSVLFQFKEKARVNSVEDIKRVIGI
jgi:hypothetical protein